MTLIQALVLGIVQGLSEFLPISSSGHLALLSHIPAWKPQPLVFDTTLHLATALTLVVYFWSDLMILITSKSKLLFFILLGSIPAGVLGFLFESDFEERFRSVGSVTLFMFLGTLLMVYAQKFGKEHMRIEGVTAVKSIKIGFFQALALFPGVSRSGSTISGAMLSGLGQVDAARLSFLMSIPIVVLAGGYKLVSTDWATIDVSTNILAVGFISSFLMGLAVVHFLLNYLKSHGLNIFIYYRLALTLVLFALIYK